MNDKKAHDLGLMRAGLLELLLSVITYSLVEFHTLADNRYLHTSASCIVQVCTYVRVLDTTRGQ